MKSLLFVRNAEWKCGAGFAGSAATILPVQPLLELLSLLLRPKFPVRLLDMIL
jgi:hypothetical protein